MSREEPSARLASGESIKRNTVFALAMQLTSAAFTATLTLVLVRSLGAEGYGLFALAVSVGGLMTVPSDLGISASASRFIAEHRGDEQAIGVVLGRALKLKLAVGSVVSVLLVLAAEPIASAYGDPGLVWPLRAVGISVFGQSLMLLFGGAFIAQGKTSRNFRLVFSESAVEFGASVALVLLGTGATGAAFGRAIGYSFGAALGIAMTLRLLRHARQARKTERVPDSRQIARYAGNLAIVDWVYTSLHYVDAIIIGAILNPAAVGLFEAPFRIIAFLNYPGHAAASGVAPRLAANPGHERDPSAFRVALRYLILFQAAIFAVVIAWADEIVSLLFGSEFAESGDVLRALAPYVFLTGIAPLVSTSANYLGVARRRIPIALAALLVNVTLDLILIPSIGVEGAALATSAGFLIYVPAHLVLCHRILAFSLKPVALTLARAGLASGVTAAILALLARGSLTPLEALAGCVAGSGAYVAVLFVTREVSRSDVASAKALSKQVRARLTGAP